VPSKIIRKSEKKLHPYEGHMSCFLFSSLLYVSGLPMNATELRSYRKIHKHLLDVQLAPISAEAEKHGPGVR
jgi:hypothetical protein